MSRTQWCLTPLANPDKHLYGPFPSLDEANTQALRMLSPEAKLAVAESFRRPNTLTPTPCDGTRHHSALFTLPPAPAKQPPAPRIKHADDAAPEPVTLTAAIFKLTEGKLRYFAAQLGITLPPAARNRAEIISYLSTQLDLT